MNNERSSPAVLANRPDTPKLEGWMGLTEAAEILGISRQHSFKLAKKPVSEGGYKTLHRIGTSHVVVVAESEIQERLAAKASAGVEGENQ